MLESIDRKRIKILLVIDGILFGGGARGFMQLANGLIGHGYKVFVACVPSGELAPLLKVVGIEVLPVNFKSKNILGDIYHLYGHLRTHTIDIVHSQGGRADFYARMAARMLKPKIKIMSTIQMPIKGYDVGAFRKGVYRFFDWFSERYVDRFIVVSEILRETLLSSYKIQPDKVIKIYNGIELDEYKQNGKEDRNQKSEARREFGITKNVPLIGAIGRMVWQKGFEYLIEAIPATIKTSPNAKILIVGDGPLRKSLEDLSEKLRVKDNVIFTGFRSDIREILAAIDILVIPSLLEGFPMVTLEAMAMAKAIIATRIDGVIEQITDGENGILVPPQDHDALTESILKFIQDKELSKRLGRLARKKVEQEFSVEKMVAETEKVYLSLLSTN